MIYITTFNCLHLYILLSESTSNATLVSPGAITIYIASFWVQYHKILHEFVIFHETVRSSGIFRTNVIFCDTERKKLAIYVLLLAKSKNNNNLLRIRSEARWKRHVFIFMIYEEVFICIDHCFCNSNKILLLMSL